MQSAAARSLHMEEIAMPSSIPPEHLNDCQRWLDEWPNRRKKQIDRLGPSQLVMRIHLTCFVSALASYVAFLLCLIALVYATVTNIDNRVATIGLIACAGIFLTSILMMFFNKIIINPIYEKRIMYKEMPTEYRKVLRHAKRHKLT